jgi:hypothetical protein
VSNFGEETEIGSFPSRRPKTQRQVARSATFQGLPPGTYFLTAGDPRVQESRVGLRVEIASFTEERLFELRDGKIHEIER